MSDASADRPRGPVTWGAGRTVLTVLGIAAAGAVAVGAPLAGVGLGAVAVLRGMAEPGVNGDGSIDGVETFEGLSNLHVDADTRVDYEQLPPVGGDHLPLWQDCGFYDAPIVPEAGVHSLEHGAVWVTYDPRLPDWQVDALEQLATANSYLLVSPMGGLPSAVVASAWGVQLQLDDVGDERLPAFLLTYLQGPQNPEPGAPCYGGLSQPAPRPEQA